MDERAFGIVLPQKISGNLRINGGVDQSVESANPLVLNRHIALLDGRNLDLRRRCDCGRAVFPAD